MHWQQQEELYNAKRNGANLPRATVNGSPRGAHRANGGWDARKLPLLERKALLQKALDGSKRLRYVEHVDDSRGLFAAAEQAGLEGIVSKKALAPYRRGKTGDWIKVKTTAGKALIGDRGKWNER